MHFCFNGQLERGYNQQSLPKRNFTLVDICITFFNNQKIKKLKEKVEQLHTATMPNTFFMHT